MKTKRYLLATILKGAGFFLFLIILATCDVGLGPSVDTESPVVTVTNPAASAVVKGRFSMDGDAKDDGKIKSAIVTFKGIGTTTGLYSFNADVENKQWKLSVDSINGTVNTDGNVTPVEDGTYQFTITVNDDSGKSTSQMTTFTVDNTAPVILVTSPDEKSAKLDYDLQFEGKIYDATEIDSIIVTVYDSVGNEIISRNASLVGTSEWKLSVDGESELLIGTANAKMANGNYTYTVTASDKVGNSSTYFFHKEDIYKKYTKNKLSIDNWAAFDKETKNWAELVQDSNDTTFANTSEEHAWLDSIRIPADSSVSYDDKAEFTYSDKPVAHITWNNLNTTDSESTDPESGNGITNLNSGDPIIGSITPPTGVDSPFRNESFEAYIWDKSENDDYTEADKVPADKVSITNIGTARSFSISTEGRDAGNYYIYIRIKNSSNTVFEARERFGISLSSPKLNMNVSGLSVIINDYDFQFEGTSKTSDDKAGTELRYNLTKTYVDENGDTVTDTMLDANNEPRYDAITVNPNTGAWILPIDNEDGTYAYTFLSISGDFKTTESHTITLDTTAPSVEISSIEQSENGSYLTATGNADDNLSGLKKLEYCLLPKTEPATEPGDDDWRTPVGSSLYTWKLTAADLNTTSLPEGEYTLHVKLTDKAENSKETYANGDITLDKYTPELTVTVEDNNWSWQERKTISGTASDTHFSALTVKLDEEDPETLEVNSETHAWSWTPPSTISDGSHNLVFTATDSVGKTKTISKTFVIDQEGPQLEVLNLDNNATYTTGGTSPLIVRGTASDTPAGTASLWYSANGGAYVQGYPNADYTDGVEANWKLNITGLPEGSNTLRIKAIDRSGNCTFYPPEAQNAISFTTDYAYPTAFFGTNDDSDGWDNRNSTQINTNTFVILTGKALDGKNTAGATLTLKYSKDGTDGPDLTVTWDKNPESATYGKWIWTQPSLANNGDDDGTYTFTLTVTDVAGRTTTTTRNVCIDTTAPDIVTGLSDNAEAPSSFNTATNRVSVSCSDSLSGLARVSWFLFNKTTNAYETEEHLVIGTYTGNDGQEHTVSSNYADITFAEGENQKVKFVAVDKSGNSCEKEYTGITVDFNPPEFNEGFATSAPNYIKLGDSPFKIITATDPDTVVAHDAIAIDSFEVKATKDGIPQKLLADGTVGVASGTESWYSLTDISDPDLKASDLSVPDFTGNIGNGKWVVTINVYDKSGWSASKTYSFTVDTTKPVVDTIEDVLAPKDMGSISYMFSGTANDVDDSGSGVKKIEVAFTSGANVVDNNNEPLTNDAINTIIGTNPKKTASGQNDWTYNLVFSDFTVFEDEGVKTIHVRATDAAGNVGDWKSSAFVYDKSLPTSSIISYKNANAANYAALPSSSFYTGQIFSLKGKVYDSYQKMGIAKVEVYQKNGTNAAVKIATISGDSNLPTLPADERDSNDPATTQYWTIDNLPRAITTDGEGNPVVSDEASLVDGNYTFYAVAMDKSGAKYDAVMNTTAPENPTDGKIFRSLEITVTIDTTAPTLKMDAAMDGITGVASLSESSYVFRGNASDPSVNSDGTGASGIAAIKYAFVRGSDNNFTKDDSLTVSSWQTLSTSGSWTIMRTLAKNKDTTTPGQPFADDTLNEGHWYLFVKAVDNAGNESSAIKLVTTENNVDTVVSEVQSIHFHADKSVPSLAVTTNGLKSKENSVYYFNTNDTAYTHDVDPDSNTGLYAISGTATDSYGISNITVQVGEASAVSITPANGEDTWTYNVAVTDDTATPITITAIDNSGKTVSKSYTLYRDTTAPNLTINSPADEESFRNNTISPKGSITDDGVGVGSISYSITKVGETEPTKSGSITRTGESWKTDNSVDFRRLDETSNKYITQEGSFTFKITAEDSLGNSKEETSVFYVDTANPSVTETGINTASKTVKSNFTLSGFVYDSNALASTSTVVITADSGLSNPVKFDLSNLESVTDQPGWYKWEQTFSVGEETAPSGAISLADGSYIFTITANDVAEKSAVVQRTITVDTRAPVFTVDAQGATLDYSGNNADKIKTIDTGDEEQLWFTDSVVTIKVAVTDQKVSDDAEADEGSGLSTVKYETLDGKSGYLMKSSENGSNDWSTSISFSEGTGNGIRIIAEDAAGNKKIYPEEAPVGTAQYETIRIDTKVPNISLNELSDLLTNGGEEKHFTISGTASDVTGGTGMDSVSAKIGETEYTMDEDSTAENWKITFNTPNADESATTNRITSDGTYVITITAKDNAGLEKTIEKTVTVDTTPATFSNNAKINNNAPNIWFGTTSLDVTGSFTDANSIDSVQWSWDSPEAIDANGVPKAVWRSFDKSISGDSTTGYTCSFSGSVPAEKTVKGAWLYIKAIDKAGNINNQIIKNINVDLDYPTVVITSIDGKEPNGAPLVNGESDLPVTVEAKDLYATGTNNSDGSPKYDTASGINSVKLTIGTKTIDGTKNGDTWNFNIAAADIKNLGNIDQSTITIKATDKVGKTAETSFKLKVDNTPPRAVITSPLTGDVLNKEVHFIGNANDENDLITVNLYYSTGTVAPTDIWDGENPVKEAEAARSKWVLFKTFSGQNGYNWDETIDTRAKDPADDTLYLYDYIASDGDGDAHIRFKVEAFDAANNSGSSTVTSCKINQFSDCPTITLNRVGVSGTDILKGSKTIDGTISDDDGDISELFVSSDNLTWEKLNIRNGSYWSYTYSDSEEDGWKTLYFKIKDKGCKENEFFYSKTGENGEDVLDGIYLTDSSGTKRMGALTFCIDMNPPQIDEDKFKVYAHNGTNSASTYDNATSISGLVLGGTNKYIDLFAEVTDANGIDSISVKAGGETINGIYAGTDNTKKNGIWKMNGIDVSKLGDGTQNLLVTAYDATGSIGTYTLVVNVDKAAPDFSIISHNSETEVTGDVILRGMIENTGLSNAKSVKYMIPTRNSADSITADTDTAENKWHDMSQIEGTSTWQVEFTKEANNQLKNYTGEGNAYSLETSTNSNIWKVPVYIRTEDEVGNTKVYGKNAFWFFVNPDGDKPKASITYPTTEAKLGGTIRVFGSAEDNEAVDAVYMQIDCDGIEGFTVNDKATLEEKNESFDIQTFNEGTAEEWWGIKVNGKESWNQTINSQNEFESTIRIRVRAVDNKGTTSNDWSDPVTIKIVTGIPLIGSSEQLRLVQYDNSDNEKASQDYQDDISIKGNWYLVGSAEFSYGIKSLTVTTVADGNSVLNGNLQVLKESGWGGFNDGTNTSAPVIFRIPVTTGEKSGSVQFKITAIGNSNDYTDAIRDISIKYDNTAPVFGTDLKYNMSNVIGSGEDEDGDGVPDSVVIEQSNKTFSIEGTVSDPEGGSGFSRIAIYFKRAAFGTVGETGYKPERIYNPAIAKDGTGNCTNIDGTTIKLVDGLPTYTVTVSNRTAEDKITLPGTLDPNIRKGGLVRIGGVYRLITDVSGNTVTFTPSVSTDQKTAEFVFALVIDNFKIESPVYNDTTGALTRISNDDGDNVIESIEKNGSSYDWSISIDSKQIPDGSIDICCVAFDNAGNMSEVKTVGTKVFNNRPAIARIRLGTDYNGNGTVESTEFQSEDIYSVVLDKNGNWKKTSTTIGLKNASDFTAVGNTIIQTEVVGGNGTLNYYYSNNNSDFSKLDVSDSDSVVAYVSSGDLSTEVASYINGNNSTQASLANIMLKLQGQKAGKKLAGLGNGEHTYYVKIYDTTDNCTGNAESIADNDSQWASFAVKFNVKVVDAVPPIAEIKPFYWNGNTDNSLYLNSTAYGHIELSADLKDVEEDGSKTFKDSTGLYDLDPKVSGIIRIKGTAKDETRLDSIQIKVDGFTALSDFTEVSKFNGSWTSVGNTVTDRAGNVIGVELNDAGYGFFVTDNNGVTSAGHDVTWELDIDTSKITGVAAIDKAVYVKIFDADGNPDNAETNASGEVVLENDNPKENASLIKSYRMDIVPYIVKVYTRLATLKKNNWSVYNRTSLGNYPVASTEDIYLYGFNLGSSAYKPYYSETALAAPVSGNADPADDENYPYGSDYKNYQVVKFPVSNVTSSGGIAIKVNGVESLNNKNGNDSFGGAYTVAPSVEVTGDKSVYDNYYNRQPNGENNNLFTDDVILDVWQINSNVAQAQGSAYIAEAIMKINPVSGMLNFAYNSGPANFSMANGTTTSHTTWVGNLARMTSAGFAVDENGVTHGITVGLDTNPSSGSAGRMQYVTSKWGPVYSTRDQAKGTQENYGGVNSSRFETIGAPKGTYNGTTYDDFLFMEDRFASPSLATAIHKDDSNKEHTYVFLAYYDDLNNEIRFRYGDLDATTEHTVGRSFGCFQDAKLFGYGGTADGDHKSFDTNKYPQYFSVIASPSTTAKSGNYLSIDIIKGSSVDEDVIVATWQDSAAGNWYYAYKKKPCTDNDVGAVPAEGASTDGYWSPPLLIASKAGEDCHISVDPRGGVHIAAYDSSEANLLYAYFANYSDSTPQLVTVDSYGFTGEHLTLDTAISADGHYVVPFIGYYMSSARKPAIARLDKVISASSGIGTIPEGVDSKDYNTGKWEISIVPTDSTYSDNYAYSHVNVGVWKNNAGLIKKSTRPASGMTNVDTWTGANKAVGDETNGYFWGNGTANPVMGYAIRVGTRGYIETAQMK